MTILKSNWFSIEKCLGCNISLVTLQCEMTDEVSKKMYATIKDCGRPYDPVPNGVDAASFGARSASLHVYHECYNDSMG